MTPTQQDLINAWWLGFNSAPSRIHLPEDDSAPEAVQGYRSGWIAGGAPPYWTGLDRGDRPHATLGDDELRGKLIGLLARRKEVNAAIAEVYREVEAREPATRAPDAPLTDDQGGGGRVTPPSLKRPRAPDLTAVECANCGWSHAVQAPEGATIRTVCPQCQLTITTNLEA